MAQNTELKTKTIKEFITENNFVEFASEVRTNIKGYPYIIFINDKNESTTIYFSKNLAGEYKAGQKLVKGFFDKLQIVYTTNAAGEERIKLAKIGSSRVSAADLL